MPLSWQEEPLFISHEQGSLVKLTEDTVCASHSWRSVIEGRGEGVMPNTKKGHESLSQNIIISRLWLAKEHVNWVHCLSRQIIMPKTSREHQLKYQTLFRSLEFCQGYSFEAKHQKYICWVLGSGEAARLTSTNNWIHNIGVLGSEETVRLTV